MPYETTRNWTDAEDNKRLNEVGHPYPREGLEVSQERIDYLLNKGGDFESPFIKFVDKPKDEEDKEFPKHTGGGYYELSNGEKVKGKEAAEKAENELKVD